MFALASSLAQLEESKSTWERLQRLLLFCPKAPPLASLPGFSAYLFIYFLFFIFLFF